MTSEETPKVNSFMINLINSLTYYESASKNSGSKTSLKSPLQMKLIRKKYEFRISENVINEIRMRPNKTYSTCSIEMSLI